MISTKVQEIGKKYSVQLFSQLVTEHTRIVVDVWGTWCGPCLRMKPIFEELAAIFPSIHFVSIDIDKNPWIKTFGKKIEAIPHFIFIEDGKIVAQITGGRNKDLFSLLIEEHFNLG